MKTASAKPRKFGFIARTNLYRVCVASKYPVLKFSHSYVYSSVSIFVCRRWFKRAWLSLIIETSKRKLREGGSFECRRRVVKKLNPSFFRENKKKKKKTWKIRASAVKRKRRFKRTTQIDWTCGRHTRADAWEAVFALDLVQFEFSIDFEAI